jgi:hypothetical protein
LGEKRISPVSPSSKILLEKWYGKEKAKNAKHVELFEICEYGSRPSEDDIRRLFPMIGR